MKEVPIAGSGVKDHVSIKSYKIYPILTTMDVALENFILYDKCKISRIWVNA